MVVETGFHIPLILRRLAAATTPLVLGMNITASITASFCLGFAPAAFAEEQPPQAEPPPPPEAPEPAYEPPPPSDFPESRGVPAAAGPGNHGQGHAGGTGEAEVVDDSVIKVPKPEPAKPRVVSAAERQKACAKHEGKYISYYSEIFRVEKCKRRVIQDPETLSRLMRGAITVTEVESDIIAAIPAGQAVADQGAAKRRGCKQLEGRFVTFSYVDVYLVQKCKKRLFPDWETFVAFQKKRGNNSGIGSEVIPLSDAEFDLLQIGPEMPSAVDVEFIRQYDRSKVVDLIPIDEACRGVEGKIVSFYSKLYKIEKCRKREMDPEVATLKNPSLNPKELRPEQWNSLPDGKPMKSGADETKGKAIQYKPLPHGG